ncbi:MAG: NUDIX domain-containing protein [Vulcanimicrobiaceae bacterium]
MAGYERRQRRELYRNPYIALEVHEVLSPAGVTGEHVLIVTPASCAVIVDDEGDLLFARQARFAAESEVLEVVKGGAVAGEAPLECAKRELREELDVTAASWQALGILHEIPSIVAPPVSLFLARKIEHLLDEAPRVEQIERIELVRIPADRAIAAAVVGGIDDAVTMAALLRYAAATGRLRSLGAD